MTTSARTNTLRHNTETTIGIDCLAPPERRGDSTSHKVTLECCINSTFQLKWKCVLRNKAPLLEAALSWSCQQLKYSAHLAAPSPFQSVRCVSRDGRQIAGGGIQGLGAEAVYTVKLDLEAVKAGDRLEFDIILSTRPLQQECQHPRSSESARILIDNHRILVTLMKDIRTMDMKFTFEHCGVAISGRANLWAHQSVLAHQPALARLIKKLKELEGDASDGKSCGGDSDVVRGIVSTPVGEHSLESYCCLIRCLYTGEVKLEVDLAEFAIEYDPLGPLPVVSKTRLSVKGLFSTFSSASSASSTPAAWSTASKAESVRDPASSPSEVGSPVPRTKVSTTLWKDIFQVADCHEVKELRDHCREKIIVSLCVKNVLDILFSFAYRYEDLKEEVVQFLADHIGQMYADDPDPFSAYGEHPQQHVLLAEALRRRYKS
ncbi:hypothetical protein BG004_003955 [Podila humilis]|nr:hypothetical protein BG004_003955 [Podila humilis]